MNISVSEMKELIAGLVTIPRLHDIACRMSHEIMEHMCKEPEIYVVVGRSGIVLYVTMNYDEANELKKEYKEVDVQFWRNGKHIFTS